MKNIVFLGIGSKLAANILEKIVHDNPSIETVVTIKSNNAVTLEFNRTIKLISLDFHSINLGHYDEILLKPRPVDSETISSLSPYLFSTFKIMDRLPEHDFFSFRSRSSLLFKHLAYWSTLLKDCKIDHLISLDMPHETQDYIIYALCEQYGIKKCFFMQSQIPGLCQLTSNIENNDVRLKQFNTDRFDSKTITSPIVESYLNKQLSPNHIPFYMKASAGPKSSLIDKSKKLLRSLASIIKKIFQPAQLIFSLNRYYNFDYPASRKINSLIKLNEVDAVISKKFIFIPLHYQPERTTAPQGGIFAFQELMIRMINFAIDKDTVIYVKEHPKQTNRGRSLEFYRDILSLDKVKLISSKVSTSDLIKSSYAVATVTGTAGWEAICYKKPVLLFGHIFFQFGPGVFKIKTNEDLKIALLKIQNGQTEISQENLYRFLNCCSEYLIHGFSNEVYFKESQIDWNENLSNISSAVTKFFHPTSFVGSEKSDINKVF